MGRFWVGSKAHDNTSGAGSLFRVDLDGTVTRVRTGLTIANGLGWGPDGTTMYVTDSGAGTIDAHDYDVESGRLGPPRAFLRLPAEEGSPDGLTVDADGCLWVAVWGGSEVRCYAPDATLVTRVQVGASHVTSCAFVGAGLENLAITTAQDELTAEQLEREPDAGKLHLAGSAGRGTASHSSAVRPGLRLTRSREGDAR
ncbi:MAG: SMP-30/gluconolactonase/LRE family protein [Nocardioides sp.]